MDESPKSIYFFVHGVERNCQNPEETNGLMNLKSYDLIVHGNKISLKNINLINGLGRHMEILNYILSIFPNINWISLSKTNYPRIRFYFDNKNEKSNKVIELISNLINSLLMEGEIYCCFMLFGNPNSLEWNTLESLRLRKLSHLIDTGDIVLERLASGCILFKYFNKITKIDCLNINRALIEQDFWIKPTLQLNCYYFNLKEKIIINLYDDRGMDIIGIDNKLLSKIYNKHKKDFKIDLYFDDKE